MGLFINKDEHPDVFKNNEEISESNQVFSRTDYLSEYILEQKKANDSLHYSIHDLKNLYEQQENRQGNHWKETDERLKELKDRNLQHERQVRNWLKNLEDENMKLQLMLENERLLEEELIEKINTVTESNEEIINRLKAYESANAQLALKMNEQLDLHKQMSDQISRQEDKQSEVLSRLDNQEALTEKILRQIDHIRSILFERTHYLAEKIEDGYNLTSSYVYQLITGSNQPAPLFMLNNKGEESQKSHN